MWIQNFLPNAGDPFSACISSMLKYKVVEYVVGSISTAEKLIKELIKTIQIIMHS